MARIEIPFGHSLARLVLDMPKIPNKQTTMGFVI